MISPHETGYEAFASVRMRLLVSIILSIGLVLVSAPNVGAEPREPRYCLPMIKALAAKPDSSLFPMNTKKKKRLVNRALRQQNRLFKRAELRAKADGDFIAAGGLANVNWTMDDLSVVRKVSRGNTQAKKDCGIGFSSMTTEQYSLFFDK